MWTEKFFNLYYKDFYQRLFISREKLNIKFGFAYSQISERFEEKFVKKKVS